MSAAFGPFDLLRPLGRGGMGEVFLAARREDQSGTPLVLKRIRPELAQNEEYRKRLAFEAQVASRLVHPNLVRFLEFGRVGDCDYLVMEHVAGYSLKRLLDRAIEEDRPPSPSVALTIALGILRGLATMHHTRDSTGKPRPILHRDVTPGNVILTHYGRPVLIDFGIAKDVLGPAITQIGKIFGTARYMAPEHRKGEFIEPSADVFSASMILFELLTARHPWPPMPGPREILRTVFDPPEITEEVAARIPSDVLPIVFKGMECDAADRYTNAQLMLEALEETSTVRQIESSDHAEDVKAWTMSMSIEPDEKLEGLVVDSAPSVPKARPDSKFWDHKGRIRDERPSPNPTDTIPPSQALTIPPLPPRRHSVLDTGDIRVPRELRKPTHQRTLMIGLLVVLGVVLGWATKQWLL